MTPTTKDVEPTISATDELRRLLDERGVRWWEEDGHTLWYGQSTNHAASAFSSFMFGENDKVHLSAMVTPAQAIAATLGSGECHDARNWIHHWECSECGEIVEWSRPNYCPNCGRKVVDE